MEITLGEFGAGSGQGLLVDLAFGHILNCADVDGSTRDLLQYVGDGMEVLHIPSRRDYAVGDIDIAIQSVDGALEGVLVYWQVLGVEERPKAGRSAKSMITLIPSMIYSQMRLLVGTGSLAFMSNVSMLRKELKLPLVGLQAFRPTIAQACVTGPCVSLRKARPSSFVPTANAHCLFISAALS
jgi:hypothetical protein